MTMDDKLIVGQRHREAARELADYAGFKFAADHLDMALDATAEAFARFERDHMPAATPTPVSAAVEERAREIAEIIDPEAFKGPIWMDRAGSDDAAPARMAAALKKARDIMGLAATKDDPGYFYQEVQHGMNATAALTNAQPIRAGLTQRAMMQRINEAIRMLDWCIENHYAPDSSREVAAVAGLREVKKSFPAALATPDDALTVDCDAIAEAIGKADDAFGYSFNMTMLVDGIATYTLTMDGFDSVDFEDRDDGYRLIAERRNQARATAIRALLTRAPGQGGAA